jgi:hypothetical protein
LKKVASDSLCHPIEFLDRRSLPSLLEGNLEESVTLESESERITFLNYALDRSIVELRTQANFFEVFLRHKSSLQALNRFVRIVECLFGFTVSKYCTEAAFSNFRSAASIDRIFQGLDSQLPRKMLYIQNIYAPIGGDLRNRWKAAVGLLQDEWGKALAGEIDVEKWAVSILDRVAMQLRALPQIMPTRQYFLLAKSLLALQQIAHRYESNEVPVKYAIVKANQPGLIAIFLLISALLMKKDTFHTLCSPTELSTWFSFEEVIMTIVDTREQLSNVYYALQDEILMQFSDM